MLLRQRRETYSELRAWRSSDLVLADETQNRVRKLLDEAIEDMDRLDCDVFQAEERLTTLEQQKIADADRIATLRAAISSIKKIPPETFAEIFMRVGEGCVELPPEECEHSYPWILGHVCCRWRRILWSSSCVWSTINVRRLYQTDKSCNMRIGDNILRESLIYVLLNTTALLNLTVYDDRAARIIDIIISHNNRFRQLQIGDTSQDIAFQLLDLPPTSLGNLETLALSWVCDSHLSHLNKTRSALQTIPNLRRVELSCYICPYVSLLDFLPWPRLTELKVIYTALSPHVIYTTLRRCTALRTCCFSISADPFTAPNEPLSHLNLRFVTLSVHYSFDWDRFTQPLIIRSMKELHLWSPTTLPLTPFLSLITRSKCSLESFSVGSPETSLYRPDFEPFLHQVPSLTTLKVPWIIPGTIIESIQNGLLPNLKIGYWEVDTEGFSAVLDLVDSLIPQILSHQRRLSIEVSCTQEPGFMKVQDRYLANYSMYKRIEGLSVRVVDITAWAEIGPWLNRA